MFSFQSFPTHQGYVRGEQVPSEAQADAEADEFERDFQRRQRMLSQARRVVSGTTEASV